MFLFKAEFDVTTENFPAFCTLLNAEPNMKATPKPVAESTAPQADAQPAARPAAKPTITAEDIRALATQLVRAGKQTALKELLGKYNAERLSAVTEDNYVAFKADLEVLNAG